ncbi:dentin sialophosphoprotein isoform X2 [Magallana gigas]|uniref:dentin sialophosphoprotein isoform X2 n=1 Tax=Magallana gigas TaxID=29159 RepID=UPI00333E8ABE
MYLSHPKIPSKPVKSALPVFGSISRSPRTPASSSLYSESSDGGSQGVQYSDTFVSESGIPSVGYQRKKTPRKTMISFKENDVTETIETEIPFTGRSVTEMPFTERNGKSHTERATTEIETCISENESEKFVTVTERIPSLSETKSSQSLYSNTFESDQSNLEDEKSPVVSSKSDQEQTKYDYSDTFHSTENSSGQLFSSKRDSRSFQAETDESDDSHYSTFTEESLTESSTFRSLEESVASASPTPESYTLTFEEESELDREYSTDFEKSSSLKTDYTDTFLPTDSLEDSEKVRKEAEIKKISQEAEENFVATMITHIKQQPMRETDISVLIDKELEGPEYEELDKHARKYIHKKMKVLKKKLYTGDQDTPSPENVNQWESKKTWSISDYGVHPCILDKLRLHNFIQDMEKAANTEIHDPKKCRECRAHQSSLDAAAAERNFIRLKTREVRQREMEDAYHKHLVKMDSINLIADIARSLPRPTDDPENIEDQLFKGLNLSKSICNNRLSAT